MHIMNSTRLRFLVPTLAALVLSAFVAACGTKPTPTPVSTPTLEPSPAPPANASISGRIWGDLCTVTGGTGGAAVAPSAGCIQVGESEYQANGLPEADEPGVGGVSVQLGAGSCPASGLATVPTHMNGGYTFAGLGDGTYCVLVDASSLDNAGLLPGLWTSPSTEDNVADYTVTVQENEQKTGVDFGWYYQIVPAPGPATPQPSPTPPQPTSTPAPTPSAPTAECYDQSAFVQDVSIPDNTLMKPGQSFVKTWRLRNSGTCTWTQDYALVFAGGDHLGGPTSAPLPRTVAPGEIVDLSVSLVAPAANGTYQSRWLLRNEKGSSFGVGSGTIRVFWARIVVGPPPTPTPPAAAWRAEYYDNRNLLGTPKVARDDAAVDFKWGTDAPTATGLPPDGFSVRWTRQIPLQAGSYRFSALSDDGVRVWLDGTLIIDQWHDATNVVYNAIREISDGDHTLRIEYYENAGAAQITFWWERQEAFVQWRGAYFSNVFLTGAPTLVRNDASIDFAWGTGVPAAGMPGDGFSARWTRTMAFQQGSYRFQAIVDDGVRLWVDDQLILESWSDGGQRKVNADHYLLAGDHTVRVEYYEQSGDALIRVSWERLDSYPDWRGEYWSNPTLTGVPALVRNDAKVDFDWEGGSPFVTEPRNNFSARWTRRVQLDAATYRFHVLVDDGARLWVNDRLVIDSWRDGSPRELTADVPLAQGTHSVRLEYYERSGQAQIRLWREKITVSSYPDWKGEYWPNRQLTGDPTLVRNDRSIDFRWGSGAPAVGLPEEKFSVRWTRKMAFEPGVYRFRARADDGIRVAVDSNVMLDEWHTSVGEEVYTVDVTFSDAQQHELSVEYYDQSGDALVNFWWERTGDLR